MIVISFADIIINNASIMAALFIVIVNAILVVFMLLYVLLCLFVSVLDLFSGACSTWQQLKRAWAVLR